MKGQELVMALFRWEHVCEQARRLCLAATGSHTPYLRQIAKQAHTWLIFIINIGNEDGHGPHFTEVPMSRSEYDFVSLS